MYTLSTERLEMLVSRYNNLTHFPLKVDDVRQNIEDDVNRIINNVKDDFKRWGYSEIPESVSSLFDVIASTRAFLFAESVREREAAPPWTVTGRANYKGRPDKARRIWERARERWDTVNKLLSKRVNKYNPHGLIRSDDNDAIEKLQKKIATLKDLQEKMKAANKVLKKGKDVVPQLQALGFTESQIEKLQEPPAYSFYRKGFQTFELSNNLACIKNAEARLAQLQREASRKDETRLDVSGDGWRLFEDASWGRLCYEFNGKPSEDVRSLLKSHGFKWAPSVKLWVRLLNNNARFAAVHYVNPKLPKE